MGEINIESYVFGNFGNIISDIKKIALVPSPPFKEQKKAEYLKGYIENIGYSGSETDKEGNLIFRLKGSGGGLIVFSSHIDTVFPEGTKLEIREDKDKIYCPGICDNSVGIAAQIYLMKYLKDEKIKPKSDIVFLFNVGEEESGNLRGIRYFFGNAKHRDIKAHICIEGYGIGRINTKFVGSHRMKAKISCEGGHSFRDYGNPNAIVVASKLIAGLSEIKLPSEPKTTLNIGTIHGGTSVNSIPSYAEFTLEIRSLDKDVLSSVKEKVNSKLAKASSKGIELKTEVIGDRPCGEMKDKSLVDIIEKVHKQLGIKTIDDLGSTDSNEPVSLGLPSVTIGITEGGGTHSTKEFILAGPVKKGIEQLLWIFHYLDGR